jgi:ATP-dependent phosphofructokinase / diphosphate-dependent phosphofructokinase
MAHNAFYAQSGGVTSVINLSALGVIDAVAQYPKKINKLYAGHNGILGALKEELLDLSQLTEQDRLALRYNPGGAFGSCRYKLSSLEKNRREYEQLLRIFKAHNIRYFFYNGGGDSQDTALKVSLISQEYGYPITAIGIPKTVDNDLPFTDHCPGFGSVAKYIATATIEATLDVASMASNSTKVFILEVMGRHSGWIAAASALGQSVPLESPHLILFPERPVARSHFIQQVQEMVNQYGFCVVVTSEGVKNTEGHFLSATGGHDAFGHTQLGGAAVILAQWIKEDLSLKYHWAVPDYLQRAARHLASGLDVEQSYALGKAAVEYAVTGHNAIMPIIKRLSDNPYQWTIDSVPLSLVANIEKTVPEHYIRPDGFGITEACRRYLLPLIQGEAFPPFVNGLPEYRAIPRYFVQKKCSSFFIEES